MLIVLTIAVAIVIPLLCYYLVWSTSRQEKVKACPLASSGFMECISEISGSNAPWFLLNHSRNLKSPNFRLRLPLPPVGEIFVVGDPKLTREILSDNLSDKPHEVYKSFRAVVGGASIFSSPNDAYWRHVRKATAQAFASKEIDRMNQICSIQCERWIQNTLDPIIETGSTFDPAKEMIRLTMRVISEAAFEYNITDDEIASFTEDLEISLREFMWRQAVNPLRQVFGGFLPEVRRAFVSCRRLNAFAQKLLDTYREKPDKSTSRTVIRIINEHTEFASDKERRTELLTFLIGGHDTTGYTLSNAFYHIAKHHECADILRQELRSQNSQDHVSTKDSYMQQFLRESMRSMPIAATGSIRTVGRDFLVNQSLADGSSSISYCIPKGAIVFMPQVVCFRHETVFAPNPDEFDPSRWGNDKVTKTMLETIGLQFSAGMRNCLGQALANAEVNAVFARLAKDYDFKVEREGKPDYFLTLKYMGARLSARRVR